MYLSYRYKSIPGLDVLFMKEINPKGAVAYMCVHVGKKI